MKSWTIVGYTYQADHYCPDCILDQVKARYRAWYPHHHTAAWGHSTEDTLDVVANRLRDLGVLPSIDRTDERSFDSGDFPKVIFADQVHDTCTADEGYKPGQCGDSCGGCHEPLGFDCPNVAEDTDDPTEETDR